MNLCVVGGSNGGYATAADLALAGHRVRLWRRAAAELAPVLKAGAITLAAKRRWSGSPRSSRPRGRAWTSSTPRSPTRGR